MNIYLLVGLYFAAFTKLICTWYTEIQFLTSLVTDMLIYHVANGNRANTKRTCNLPSNDAETHDDIRKSARVTVWQRSHV